MQESVSKNLGHQNFYKMNHKWKDNVCTKCGIKRKKHTFKIHMAVMNHPPWNAWRYERVWVFFFNEAHMITKRPECVRKKDDRVHTHTEQSEV